MDGADKKLSFTGMAIVLLEDGTQASMDAILGVIACAEESVYVTERHEFDERITSDALVETDLSLRCAVEALVCEYEQIISEG